MTRATRNKIIIIVLLYAGSFMLIYFAKPLSILSTCQRDVYPGCDEFLAYFQARIDGYHGDYSEFRDKEHWDTSGIILFCIAGPFLLLLVSKIYRTWFKPTLQFSRIE